MCIRNPVFVEALLWDSIFDHEVETLVFAGADRRPQRAAAA